METKKALLLRMTNRGRTFVFQKATRAIANALEIPVHTEIFLDTSIINDPMEGQTLLTKTLQQITEQYSEYIIILVKDGKWTPSVEQIKTRLLPNKLYAVDIPIEQVEYYATNMDTDGFISYIVHLALAEEQG